MVIRRVLSLLLLGVACGFQQTIVSAECEVSGLVAGQVDNTVTLTNCQSIPIEVLRKNATIATLHLSGKTGPRLEGYFPTIKTILTDGSGTLQVVNASMPSLTKADLEGNAITSFDGNFPNLTELNLKDNKLKQLRGRMPKLSSLDMAYNKLRTFKMNHTTLQYLYLHDNSIGSIAINMPKLRTLFISHNRLTKFKSTLPELTDLILSDNLLTEFKCTFPKLTSLSIQRNKLTKMPSVVFRMTKPRALAIDFNLLAAPFHLTKAQLQFLKSIQILYFDGVYESEKACAKGDKKKTIPFNWENGESVSVCVAP